MASSAFAAELTTEIGARYWHSSGGPEYTLYGGMSKADGAVSALQYKSKNVATPEVFFRVDHTSGVFVKGLLSGTGTSNSGVEYDEDFEPETDPYSRTETSLLKSEVKYGSVDLVRIPRDGGQHSMLMAGSVTPSSRTPFHGDGGQHSILKADTPAVS